MIETQEMLSLQKVPRSGLSLLLRCNFVLHDRHMVRVFPHCATAGSLAWGGIATLIGVPMTLIAGAGGLAIVSADRRRDGAYDWGITEDVLLNVQVHRDWTGGLTFFALAVAVSAEETLALVSQLVELQEHRRELVKDRRADSASRRLVEHLIGTPVISVKQAVGMFGCSVSAAGRALADLVSLGILERQEGSRCIDQLHNEP